MIRDATEATISDRRDAVSIFFQNVRQAKSKTRRKKIPKNHIYRAFCQIEFPEPLTKSFQIQNYVNHKPNSFSFAPPIDQRPIQNAFSYFEIFSRQPQQSKTEFSKDEDDEESKLFSLRVRV